MNNTKPITIFVLLLSLIFCQSAVTCASSLPIISIKSQQHASTWRPYSTRPPKNGWSYPKPTTKVPADPWEGWSVRARCRISNVSPISICVVLKYNKWSMLNVGGWKHRVIWMRIQQYHAEWLGVSFECREDDYANANRWERLTRLRLNRCCFKKSSPWS